VHRPESSGVGAEHVFATLWQGRALFDACGYVAGTKIMRQQAEFATDRGQAERDQLCAAVSNTRNFEHYLDYTMLVTDVVQPAYSPSKPNGN